MLFKGFFYFLAVAAFCSAEQNHFNNFGKGLLKGHPKNISVKIF